MMRKPKQYKLQYFSDARNKWVDSCSMIRGSLGMVSKEAKNFSKLPNTMDYRAVPVKTTKEKQRSSQT